MSLRISSLAALLLLTGSALAQPTSPAPAAPPPAAQPAPSQPAPAPSPAAAPPAADQPAPAPAPAPAPSAVPPTPAAPPPAAETIAPPPLAVAGPAEPPVEAAAAEEAAAEAPPPKKLSVGTKGLFQPGALIQGWYQLQRTDETTNTLRIRRAELSAKGDIIPDCVSYAIMIDPARVLEEQNTVVMGMPDVTAVTIKQPPGPVAVLQDVFATFKSSYLDVSMGQFKIPVGWESNYPTAKQLFAERAMVSRQFADRRDIGIRMTKTFKYFGYTAGLFNGAGQNNLDTNNQKDGSLRLEAYPVEGMMFAVVGYATLWNRNQPTGKDRWEIDARYDHAPFIIQAEYIRARDVSNSGPSKGQGFYTTVGYYLIADHLQGVLRLGYVKPAASTTAESDPSMSSGAFKVWSYEAGLTYYILKDEAKLLLNYGYYDYKGAPNNNELIAAVQLWY